MEYKFYSYEQFLYLPHTIKETLLYMYDLSHRPDKMGYEYKLRPENFWADHLKEHYGIES